MRKPNYSEQIADWVLYKPPLITSQKIAISAAAVFCFLSTAVCAPMGGSGGQSLLKTDHPAAYWSFFFLSPILILLLCGRAAYLRAKSETAPINRYLMRISKPPPSLLNKCIRYTIFLFLSCLGGAFNSYNTMQYLPYWLAIFCVGPALIIPGFPLVPAFVEYHQRIWAACNWLIHNKVWRKQQKQQPIQRLISAERQYEQLSVEQRGQANATFLLMNNENKLKALFNPALLCKGPSTYIAKPKLVYTMGALGFVIGTIAELYSFSFAKNMAALTGPIISTLFGIGVSYVRMGISAVATMDVFTNMAYGFYVFCHTQNKSSLTKGQGFLFFNLFVLAVAASMPNVQNQIQTIGHEGIFGHALAICAMIAPACVAFWAGDLVFRDYLYDTPGLTYKDCHERLFNGISVFKQEYIEALKNFEKKDLFV